MRTNTLLKILFLITIPSFILSQEKTRIVTLLEQGEKVTVEVDNTHKKIHTKVNKTYYWVKSKSIFNTQASYQGVLLHGKYIKTYKTNQLKEEGEFYYGLKNKTWKYWNKLGELIKIEKWRKGKLIETIPYHSKQINKEDKKDDNIVNKTENKEKTPPSKETTGQKK